MNVIFPMTFPLEQFCCMYLFYFIFVSLKRKEKKGNHYEDIVLHPYQYTVGVGVGGWLGGGVEGLGGGGSIENFLAVAGCFTSTETLRNINSIKDMDPGTPTS